jgi:glycosyltransferase involved in cell wall biosynthesis
VTDPAVSIIIPAHNEEALLGATLDALAAAVGELGEIAEIIVVDDASTDATATIAKDRGATVVPVAVRQIAAARNAGARAARGDLFVFVDADTIVPPATLRNAVEAWRGGAVGGGAGIASDAASPPWLHRTTRAVAAIMRAAAWAAGCFVFARRDAFERVGGFDERYFASEEIHLSRALKRHGRFVIVAGSVMTSGRKAERYSRWRTFLIFVRLAWPANLKKRHEFWYGRRD